MTTIKRMGIEMTAVLAAVSMATLMLTNVGCATNEGVGRQVDDATLTAKINARLAADPQVNPFEIDVDTTRGHVRLSGWVESDEEKDAAERIAENTAGVIDVENEISLGDPSAKENVEDAAILAAVKTKLTADPDVNSFNIDVDVSRGTVTLTGEVADDGQVEEAERIARNTRGVDAVENRLEVKESKQD